MTIPAYHSPHGATMRAFEETAWRMQALVDAILGRLTDAGIPWCLLRNRDLIPWGLLQWSDLDIMVPASVSRERLVALFSDLQPTRIVPFRHGVTYMFFPFEDMFLRVDVLHGDTGWLGAPYSDNEEILAARWDDNGIMVAAPLHQAYLTWCNRLVRGGELPERYQDLIRAQAREHPQELRRLFERHIGPDLARTLLRLAETGTLDQSPRYAWSFKRALWLTAFRHHPVRTICSTARHMAYGIRRRIEPPGMEIVILSGNRAEASRLCSAFATSSSRSVPGVRAEYRQHKGEQGERVCLIGEFLRAWFDHLIGDRGARARMTFIFRDWHLASLEITRDQGHVSILFVRLAARLAPRPDLYVALCGPGTPPRTSRSDPSPEPTPGVPGAVQMIARDSLPSMMDSVVRLIQARITAKNTDAEGGRQ